MNQIKWVIAGCVTIVLAFSLYQWNRSRALNAEIDSQVATAQAKVLRDLASESKKAAEASDLKVVEMAKTTEAAKQTALAEHAKSDALKKKLASLGVVPIPGPGGMVGDSELKDQIIVQQDNEIMSLQVVIKSQDEEIKTLTVSRDQWRESALKFEGTLQMTDKQIRALEIQRDALKRSGWMREGKGMLEGGAAVFLLHLLKVL